MINIPAEIKDENIRKFLSEFQRQVNSELTYMETKIENLKKKVTDNG